jgi:hypothetical protein
MQVKLFIVILIVLISCSSERSNNSNNHIIHLFDKNELLQFDSVDFVSLQTGKEYLIGNRIKFLQASNKDIFIGNFNSNHLIFRFNKNGLFLNTIGHKGKAEGEYVQMNDFIITGDTIEILSGNGIKSHILKYLNTGKYISEITVNIGAISFARTGTSYIFSTNYNRVYKNRVHLSNLNGELTMSFLPNNTSIIPITEWNFTKYSSNILYRESFNNKTYIYSDNKFKMSYTFDFDKYNIPNDFYKNSFLKEFEKINSNGFANITKYYENNNFAVFEILIQKANQPSVIHHTVLLKKTGKLLDYSIKENDKTKCLFNLVGISSNNELIYLQYPNEVLNKLDLIKNLPSNQLSKLKQIKPFDNPIIFYCKIKNMNY